MWRWVLYSSHSGKRRPIPLRRPILHRHWPSKRPTPEPIRPPWATHPWADPPLSNPPLSWPSELPTPPTHSSSSHSTVCFNLSLCHLSPSLTIDLGILIFLFWFFVSLIVYISWFSVIIFVWILRKCEKHDKNGFFRAFSETQLNTRKYFLKYFLKCN